MISLEETFVEIQVSWKTHFKIYILHTNKNDIYIYEKSSLHSSEKSPLLC